MTPATTKKHHIDLHGLLVRIRDDPDAGPWAEWACRLIERSEDRKCEPVAETKAHATPLKEQV